MTSKPVVLSSSDLVTQEQDTRSIAEIRADLRKKFAPLFWRVGVLSTLYEAQSN